MGRDIIYCLIAKGRVVLAEYTSTSGNFQTITRVLLNKLPKIFNEDESKIGKSDKQKGISATGISATSSEVYGVAGAEVVTESGYSVVQGNPLNQIGTKEQRRSFIYDSHVFHVVVEDGITYLCLAEEGCKKRIPFSFLDNIKEAFKTKYSQDAINKAIAFQFNDSFSPIIRQRMIFFNTDPNSDAILKVNSQMDDIQDIMILNIEKIMKRGEKLELLVQQTDRMREDAVVFERTATKLKDQM